MTCACAALCCLVLVLPCAGAALQEEHPLGGPTPFNVVLETSGSNAEHDMEKLMQFLEVAMEEGA